MAEFWITAPRFVQQAGQVEPQYVDASPGRPAKIILPDDYEISDFDKTLHRIGEKPAKPRPAAAELKRESARRADGPKPLEGVRAADK